VYEFAKNTASDAFTSFPGVPVSSFYADLKANIVYDPTSSAQVFDLSSSDFINASSNSNQLYDLGAATGNYNITDIGVFDDVYYGIRSSIAFHYPNGIALDYENIYVIDFSVNTYAGFNFVRKIRRSTGEVTVLGANASPPLKPNGIAVDFYGSVVYVADWTNGQVRKIDVATDVVTNVGAATNPPLPYMSPDDVAVDVLGNVYVTANWNLYKIAVDNTWSILGSGTIQMAYSVCIGSYSSVYVSDFRGAPVKKINAYTGTITDLGTNASPTIGTPFETVSIAVDASDNVYVADTGNNNIRKIDAITGAVSTIGTKTSLAFKSPRYVAVDSDKNVYVADFGNALVRVIDSSDTKVERFGFLQPPRVFSWDLKLNANDPSSITLWPSWALNSFSYLLDITLVDLSSGGCQNVVSSLGNCYLLKHAEYNTETKLIYLQFNRYYKNEDYSHHYFKTLDPSSAHTSIYSVLSTAAYPYTAASNLLAVFQTPLTSSTSSGTVFLTDQGAISSTPDANGYAVAMSTYNNYNALLTASGTSVIDASKIPGSVSRYLLLQLDSFG